MSEDKKVILGDVSKYSNCRPVKEDPQIIEAKHKSMCLMRLRAECHTCPNSKFTLLFDVPEKRLEQVMCPRWKDVRELWQGKNPESYSVTELATCKERPFPFCGSCPSVEELNELGIDKTKDGWVSRWKRFRDEDALEE